MYMYIYHMCMYMYMYIDGYCIDSAWLLSLADVVCSQLCVRCCAAATACTRAASATASPAGRAPTVRWASTSAATPPAPATAGASTASASARLDSRALTANKVASSLLVRVHVHVPVVVDGAASGVPSFLKITRPNLAMR